MAAASSGRGRERPLDVSISSFISVGRFNFTHEVERLQLLLTKSSRVAFVAIDGEFTGPSWDRGDSEFRAWTRPELGSRQQPARGRGRAARSRLWDADVARRFVALREATVANAMVQLGIAVYLRREESDAGFDVEAFNFSLLPRRDFGVSAASMAFLARNGTDLNDLFLTGIPLWLSPPRVAASAAAVHDAGSAPRKRARSEAKEETVAAAAAAAAATAAAAAPPLLPRTAAEIRAKRNRQNRERKRKRRRRKQQEQQQPQKSQPRAAAAAAATAAADVAKLEAEAARHAAAQVKVEAAARTSAAAAFAAVPKTRAMRRRQKKKRKMGAADADAEAEAAADVVEAPLPTARETLARALRMIGETAPLVVHNGLADLLFISHALGLCCAAKEAEEEEKEKGAKEEEEGAKETVAEDAPLLLPATIGEWVGRVHAVWGTNASAGVYDTKFMAASLDSGGRATWLKYVYTRAQRWHNGDRRAMLSRAVEIIPPRAPCHQFARCGACARLKRGQLCEYDHNLERLLQAEEAQQRPRSRRRRRGAAVKMVVAASSSSSSPTPPLLRDDDWHTAAHDAVATGFVFASLCQRFGEQGPAAAARRQVAGSVPECAADCQNKVHLMATRNPSTGALIPLVLRKSTNFT